MNLHRIDVTSFERTQPVVMPPSPEPARSVIHGDTPMDRLVIALCVVALLALPFMCSGCGGGEDEPEPIATCKTRVAPPTDKTVDSTCVE